MKEIFNYDIEDFVCDETFQKYCLGSDQDIIHFWINWEKNHPEKQLLIAAAKKMFNQLNAKQGSRLQQEEELKDGIAHQQNLKKWLTEVQRETKLKTKIKRAYKFAAMFILLIGIGGLSYLIFTKANAKVQYLTTYNYQTGVKEHKTILLPDGSIIVLNKNSHIEIAKNFDAQHRSVTILGEAFFNIKHDPSHPFIVHTSQYNIQVLGTIFNVKDYPDQTETETSLFKGHILISKKNDTQKRIDLRPGQKFVLVAQAKKISRQKNIQPYSDSLTKGNILKLNLDARTGKATESSWARKTLEINNQPLDSIAKTLEDWYGVKINFTNATVKKYRYTASFNDETIMNVLNALRASYHFKYSTAENSITIF